MKIKKRLNDVYVKHTGRDYDTIEIHARPRPLHVGGRGQGVRPDRSGVYQAARRRAGDAGRGRAEAWRYGAVPRRLAPMLLICDVSESVALKGGAALDPPAEPCLHWPGRSQEIGGGVEMPARWAGNSLDGLNLLLGRQL